MIQQEEFAPYPILAFLTLSFSTKSAAQDAIYGTIAPQHYDLDNAIIEGII